MPMLKSLSHYEFIFVHGVRVCSIVTDLLVAVQFSQKHLVKRIFPIIYSCFLCWDLLIIDVQVYFQALCSVPSICMSVFVPVPQCFDYYSIEILFEVWENCVSRFFFFFNLMIALAILRLLWFYIKFWIIYSGSMKNVISNIIGLVLNLKIVLIILTI